MTTRRAALDPGVPPSDPEFQHPAKSRIDRLNGVFCVRMCRSSSSCDLGWQFAIDEPEPKTSSESESVLRLPSALAEQIAQDVSGLRISGLHEL